MADTEPGSSTPPTTPALSQHPSWEELWQWGPAEELEVQKYLRDLEGLTTPQTTWDFAQSAAPAWNTCGLNLDLTMEELSELESMLFREFVDLSGPTLDFDTTDGATATTSTSEPSGGLHVTKKRKKPAAGRSQRKVRKTRARKKSTSEAIRPESEAIPLMASTACINGIEYKPHFRARLWVSSKDSGSTLSAIEVADLDWVEVRWHGVNGFAKRLYKDGAGETFSCMLEQVALTKALVARLLSTPGKSHKGRGQEVDRWERFDVAEEEGEPGRLLEMAAGAGSGPRYWQQRQTEAPLASDAAPAYW